LLERLALQVAGREDGLVLQPTLARVGGVEREEGRGEGADGGQGGAWMGDEPHAVMGEARAIAASWGGSRLRFGMQVKGLKG